MLSGPGIASRNGKLSSRALSRFEYTPPLFFRELSGDVIPGLGKPFFPDLLASEFLPLLA
jgi:hypothetical protein